MTRKNDNCRTHFDAHLDPMYKVQSGGWLTPCLYYSILWGILNLACVDMILADRRTVSWSVCPLSNWHQIWKAFIFHIEKLQERHVHVQILFRTLTIKVNVWAYPAFQQTCLLHSCLHVCLYLVYVLSYPGTYYMVCWIMHCFFSIVSWHSFVLGLTWPDERYLRVITLHIWGLQPILFTI